MSSITYGGVDLADICGAEVVGRTTNELGVEAMRVAGRPGAVPVSTWIPPEDVRVRLMMDPGYRPSVTNMADLKHRLRAWLLLPQSGTLVLPDEPEHEYRNAMLMDAGEWTNLFEDGECVVTFTLFDPIAWGDRRVEAGATFRLGGTWPSYPAFQLVASAGSYVQVMDHATERLVRIEHSFQGGEAVRIDCADESVTIDGLDARVCVTLGSDFFALAPGDVQIIYAGCSTHECFLTERWV
ncbi:MAG: phage tail family protein [Atopobiaceae bacterium]|nr:phage tail family protein [Atopobiaceae bacterium]